LPTLLDRVEQSPLLSRFVQPRPKPPQERAWRPSVTDHRRFTGDTTKSPDTVRRVEQLFAGQKQVGLGAHVRRTTAADTRPSLVGSPGHAPQWLADGSACAVGLSASITMRRVWWAAAALIICASRGALALFPAVSAHHLGCSFPSPPSPQPPTCHPPRLSSVCL
jgi:hypothetical protein